MNSDDKWKIVVPLGAESDPDLEFESYWDIVGYTFNLTNRNGMWEECIRQWLLIFGVAGVSWYFVKCANRLYAT